MEIKRGIQKRPEIVVIYGPEGVGKSSLAAAFPGPLFIDVEDGTANLDVARTPKPTSWQMLLATVQTLTEKPPCQYETLVIDTADWAERLCKEMICQRAKVTAIGDVDYGKLYQQLLTEWTKFLDALVGLQAKRGVHLVLLAHSCLTKVDLPEESGTIDRYEMKLTHSFKVNLSQTTKEWATIVLFLNYRVLVVEVGKKEKAQGGCRVLYATHHPCWDAKNRHGLPEAMEMPKSGMPRELAAIIGGTAPAAPVVETVPVAAPAAPSQALAKMGPLPDLPPAAAKTDAEVDAELDAVFGPESPLPADLPVPLAKAMKDAGMTLGQLEKYLAAKFKLPSAKACTTAFVEKMTAPANWAKVREWVKQNCNNGQLVEAK